MALDAAKFAQKIHDALSTTVDGHRNPTKISRQTLDKAKGIIAALKAGTVTNAPGTITGAAAAGSPLSAGTGVGGVIVLTAGPMQAITSQAIPPEAAANIAIENTAIIAYISTGLVTFLSGSITGTCTNTAIAPGPLTGGAGTGGRITGLTGAAAAVFVAAATSSSGPDSLQHYEAIIDYIVDVARVSYPSNGITGVCPSGGGPLSVGAGAGGTIR